jgi:hypothetical protein
MPRYSKIIYVLFGLSGVFYYIYRDIINNNKNIQNNVREWKNIIGMIYDINERCDNASDKVENITNICQNIINKNSSE